MVCSGNPGPGGWGALLIFGERQRELSGGEHSKRYGSRPGAEYQAGNLTLAIMRTEDFGGTFSRNAMPIALQVDDVAVARERLEAKGVRFVSDTFDSGVCWQAIFLNPDGNALSLHHRYAPRDERPATP
jgi:hypothetical protein